MILILVWAAALILTAAEISSWSLQSKIALLAARIFTILFTASLAAVVSRTILKKERYFGANLLAEMGQREFVKKRYAEAALARRKPVHGRDDYHSRMVRERRNLPLRCY